MILQLDAGNTRVKWRVIGAQREKSLPLPTEGFYLMQQNSPEHDLEFCRHLGGLGLPGLNRVQVSNVRGDGFQAALTGWVKSSWGIAVEFAEPVRVCAGVTNGYEVAARLGVDRWLAMLAAYDKSKTDCRIVNCGTTITLDLVDSKGVHQGGYIVPGLHLMRQSLQDRASRLVSIGDDFNSAAPGRDTSAAICHGILAMVTGLLVRVRKNDEQAELTPRWVISGGDGELIKSQIDWHITLEPALVMDGLSLALP